MNPLRLAGTVALTLLISFCPGANSYADRPSVNLAEPPHLDVNRYRFADSSLIDFSSRLGGAEATTRPPAGEHSFLTVDDDGQFCFADGQSVRFWGVNVAKESVFQPHATIEAAAEIFARAGFNLVRLHHLDDVEGLLPPQRVGQQPRLDPQRLDAVDYWIAALKQRGIYVYLDLLDYRTFWESEGIPNGSLLGRGAKPYAVFAEKIIECQIEYARALLADHINPYTGLSYAQDPAVAMIELCDENGLLATEKQWRQIIPPYRRELLERWNNWLRDRYHTTEKLAEMWRRPDCSQPLAQFESLEAGTVSLPHMALAVPQDELREADARRFAVEVHRSYFRRMREALRQVGVRVPISAVGDFEYPADVFAVARELDFIAANYYFAHPFFKLNRPDDVLAYFEAGNPLAATGSDSAIRRLCGPRVAGKPLVIREWNVCWPNPHRAAGLLQASQYAAAQGVDAMILFTYGCQPDADKLCYFDISADPSRWGLAAIAGEIFRSEQLRPATTVEVVFAEEDIFASPDETLTDAVYDLGEGMQVVNWFPGCPPVAADRVYLRPAAHRRKYEILQQSTQEGQPTVIERLSASAVSPLTSDRFAFTDGQEVTDTATNDNSRSGAVLTVSDAALNGTLVWCSLDGKPAALSQAWLLKQVGLARNSGQRSRSHFVKSSQKLYALLEGGIAPVITGGHTAAPLTVEVGGQPVVSVNMAGGVWELVRQGDDWLFYCDTPGIALELPQLPKQVEMTVFTATGRHSQIATQPLAYPAEALLIRLQSASKT